MYQIKQEYLQAILQYLSKRPYQESYKLIEMVQSAEELNETKEKNSNDSKET